MMTRNQISAFLALAVLYWIGLLALRGVPLSWEMLLPFSGVVAAVSLTLLVFDLWAWKLKVLRGWLIKRPILAGVWKAELKSDWINPETGAKVPPIECFMVVEGFWAPAGVLNPDVYDPRSPRRWSMGI